uniref:Secreted protein n=1 Tax=Streptomyces sp. NBC_00003 TaxID=2903608 RepID=A0AAU2UW84_9ACTN
MIKQVLAGAAFATAATMAVAMPASATAHTTGPQAHKTPTDALQRILATNVGQGPTASGDGATNFGTSNGNTSVAGESGGILNNHGAPLGHIDGRCLVGLPEGEGIGGHLLGTVKDQCNVAPVNQFQAPQKLL